MESIVFRLNPQVPKEKAIQLLHACLLELEPRTKLAVELRFWEQMTIAQVAFILKTSWEDADRMIERAFLELHQMLTERLANENLAANAA